MNLNSLFSRERKTNHCLCCSIGVPSTTWPSTENHAVCLQFTWSWSSRDHHHHHMIVIIITWSSLLSRDCHHHHVIIVITWTSSSSSRNYHHHVIVIIITWSSSSPRDLIMLIIIMGSKSSSWWSASMSLSHLYRWNEGKNNDTGCSYFPTFVEMLSDGKESVCFPRLSPDGSKLVRTRYCIKIKLCGCMYSRICYIIAVYQLTMTC